jgi:DNA-binding GntR family transcriptional regulator
MTEAPDYLEAALERIVRPLFAFSMSYVARHQSFDVIEDAELPARILQAIKRRDPDAAREVFRAALTEWRTQAETYLRGEPLCGAQPREATSV